MVDLYLYSIQDEDHKLIKIPHLTKQDADIYAKYWLDMNEFHDYIIMGEGGTPFKNEAVVITTKTPEWISLEYNRLHGGI